MTGYDMIALFVIGFSHLYLYRQFIRYERLSLWMVAGISFLFSILLFFTVTLTGFPEWNGILLVVFLLGVGRLKGGVPFVQSVYFALFSTVGLTLAKVIGLEATMQLYMSSPWNLYIWTPSLLHAMVTVLILVSLIFSRKQIARYGAYATTGPVYRLSYLLLIAGYAVVMLLSSPASLVQTIWYEQAAYISYAAAFVLFFLLGFILLISRQMYKDRRDAEERQLLDKELLAYIEELEKIHDEFISFRHDYLGVLQTLDEGVRLQDMQLLSKVYRDTVAPTSERLRLREYDLLKLSRVAVPEVKSVLGIQLMKAYQRDLHVLVDIPTVVETIWMPVTDFVRILTILVDNAIEEAAVSDEKRLELALFAMDDTQYVIVRNSSRPFAGELSMLYLKHESDKGKGRGVGLYSLKRILERIPHASLQTDVQDRQFSQQLQIKRTNDRLG